MAVNWFEVARQLMPHVERGDTLRCLAEAKRAVEALPHGPFHKVLELDFTNPPESVAAWLDGFVQAQAFPVAALYVEMNGFDINPDRWYADPFGYREFQGYSDLDWLSSWDSNHWPELTLAGMEPLQEIYADEQYEEEGLPDPDAGLASLLVTIRFQDLIRRAIPLMTSPRCPVLATAHDYDFIAIFKAP